MRPVSMTVAVCTGWIVWIVCDEFGTNGFEWWGTDAVVKSIYLLSFFETTIFLLSNKQSFKITGVDWVIGAIWLVVVGIDVIVGKDVVLNVFVAELFEIIVDFTWRLSEMKKYISEIILILLKDVKKHPYPIIPVLYKTNNDKLIRENHI